MSKLFNLPVELSGSDAEGGSVVLDGSVVVVRQDTLADIEPFVVVHGDAGVLGLDPAVGEEVPFIFDQCQSVNFLDFSVFYVELAIFVVHDAFKFFVDLAIFVVPEFAVGAWCKPSVVREGTHLWEIVKDTGSLFRPE